MGAELAEEEVGLALTPTRLRFTATETERDYQEWLVVQVRPVVVLWAATTIGFSIVFTLLGFAVASSPWVWATCAVLACACNLFIVAAYRRSSVVAVRAGTWLFNLVGPAGLVAVASTFAADDRRVLLMVGATFISLSGFAASRGDLRSATLQGVMLAALAALGDAQMWRTGSLGTFGLSLDALWISTALAAGIATTVANERSSREAYRSTRIIERQKLIIARERARSETLLQQELRHQVAERSRELGSVLAKSDATLDVRTLAVGERFHGRYKIMASLGAGGMGAVYEVERLTDAEKLALKVVIGEVTGARAARFAREAEIGARVRHLNLVSIVDVGVASGVPFLVMELVRGGSLEAQRARFGDEAWARPLLAQIAEGLAALHEAGVVHRDLKPANVLLADGVAKISDFGISRFGALDDDAIDPTAATIAPTPRSSDLTGTGVVMGTPQYMAPEAARGGRAIDAAADVFAFGILAHELLTGSAPFAVPVVVLAMAAQPIPPPPPLPLSEPLATTLARALDGDPTRRPRARQIAEALRGTVIASPR